MRTKEAPPDTVPVSENNKTTGTIAAQKELIAGIVIGILSREWKVPPEEVTMESSMQYNDRPAPVIAVDLGEIATEIEDELHSAFPRPTKKDGTMLINGTVQTVMDYFMRVCMKMSAGKKSRKARTQKK